MIRLFNMDCLEKLKIAPENSVDALITDPPAGISFMGKDWDSNKGGSKEWIAWMTEIMTEVHRVLKPGAHGLVWAIPRTSHWTATALENAGFEIRDVVTHLFGSGFPKSLDVSKAIDKAAGAVREIVGPDPNQAGRKKNTGIVAGQGLYNTEEPRIANISKPATDSAKQWSGWGTALKPASEHWILIRKPISEKTVAKNVLKWGVGGINIDGSRIETSDNLNGGAYSKGEVTGLYELGHERLPGGYRQPQGRFPANLILSDDAIEMLGEPARFFYCAKASKRERNEGLEGMPEVEEGIGDPRPSGQSMQRLDGREARKNQNHHPTVKPQKLMEYLINLITPPNGTVLDPFMGSGSTGVAAKKLGFKFIGIEKEKEYFEIAERRIGA
jgi:DNA modification methylase